MIIRDKKTKQSHAAFVRPTCEVAVRRAGRTARLSPRELRSIELVRCRPAERYMLTRGRTPLPGLRATKPQSGLTATALGGAIWDYLCDSFTNDWTAELGNGVVGLTHRDGTSFRITIVQQPLGATEHGAVAQDAGCRHTPTRPTSNGRRRHAAA